MDANLTTSLAVSQEPSPAITSELATLMHEQAGQLAIASESLPAVPDADPDENFATWFLAEQTRIEAVEAQVKKQAAYMLATLKARRLALARDWGTKFKQIVDAKLASAKGKKKSVTFATGNAGYRKSREGVDIIDPAALLEWCSEHCADALEVKVARTTPILQHIQNTGEIPPGANFREAVDQFYPPIIPQAFGLPEFPAALASTEGDQE